MNRQGVRSDQLHRLPGLFDSDDPFPRGLRNELRGADIGELERYRVGRDAGIALGKLALQDTRPLAADPHRNSDRRRGAREILVNLSRIREPSSHSGNHDWRPEGLAEQRNRRVDLVKIDLRKGIVVQLDIVPIPVPALDVSLEDYLNVLSLPVAEVESGAFRGASARCFAPRCRRRSPPEWLGKAPHPRVR